MPLRNKLILIVYVWNIMAIKIENSADFTGKKRDKHLCLFLLPPHNAHAHTPSKTSHKYAHLYGFEIILTV